MATRKVEKYGLIGPDTGGLRWLGSAEEVAKAWHEKRWHHPVLRVFVNGKVSHGTAEDVKPVYDALAKLREEQDLA